MLMRYDELAMAYFPDCSRTSAMRRLHYWIATDELLRHRLRKARYRPKQRHLTQRQVKAFHEVLGLP